MGRPLLGLLVVMTLGFAPQTLRADIVYQYVTDQPSYIAAAPNASVVVTLYLQEVLTGGSTSLISANQGLFGAGVGIQRTGSTGGSTATRIASIATNTNPIGVGGGFGTNSFTNNTNVAGTGANAALIESIGIGDASGSTPDAQGRIPLGKATLTAGSAGTTTTFTITSLINSSNTFKTQYGQGNTLTKKGPFDLDSTNNAFFGGGAIYQGANATSNKFTVTVAPEPESLVLGFLASSLLATSLWKRWRR